MTEAPGVANLFADLPDAIGGEAFSTLFDNGAARVERIVSHVHQSPPGFWYDQPDDEWVLVLRGEGVIEFEGGAQVSLRAGDHLTIPRHVKHRVHKTAPQTIWLAVHARPAQPS